MLYHNLLHVYYVLFLTGTGDLFGKSLNNLENLIKLPKGCGEQNILIYAPAAFAAKYLKDTGRLATDQASQDKIRSKLNTGTFLHEIGGH